jgi:O-acetyl-ADP-ribose deacetylase (regulator of RNase III)
MEFTEMRKDLFTMPKEYYLGHCIAEDLKMGAGIAVAFQKKFNLREAIQQQDHTAPTCVFANGVFNLITKKKSSGKPTLNSLKAALIVMRGIISENGITKMAMPKIGCGLDKLQWGEVREIIKDVFSNIHPLEIVICTI